MRLGRAGDLPFAAVIRCVSTNVSDNSPTAYDFMLRAFAVAGPAVLLLLHAVGTVATSARKIAAKDRRNPGHDTAGIYSQAITPEDGLMQVHLNGCAHPPERAPDAPYKNRHEHSGAAKARPEPAISDTPDA